MLKRIVNNINQSFRFKLLKHLTFALLSALILGNMTGFSTQPVFADNKSTQISNSSNDSIAPSIATDGINIYIAWTDQSRSGPSEIFFSKSTDGGNTFSAPQNIGTKQGTSIAPFVATDGMNIFVTWTDSQPKSRDIMFSKSTDGGETFSVPQKISSDSSDSVASKIVVHGNNIFLIWFSITWSGDFSKNMEIYFSKSTDGGETFSVPQNISNNEEFSQSPSIATNGSDVFVTWSNDHMGKTTIFFSKSTDGGETFSSPKNISDNTGYSSGPFITSNGANVFVAWFYHVEGKNPDILFSKSIDGGETFSVPQNISNTSGYSVTPVIATNGSNIFITWTDSQPKSSLILFSKSTDGGLTFSSPENISGNTGFSSSQSIATDGINIFNAWNRAERSVEDRQDLLFSKIMIAPPLTKSGSEEMAKNDTSSIPLQADNPESNPSTGNTQSVKSIKWLNENGADYRVGGIGVIRMDDSEMNVNKTLIDIPVAHVWSGTDKTGIQVDMIETGADTGVFYADITLSGIESSHLQLHVSNGDTITASFEGKSLDEPLVDTVKIISKYLSPRKQLESGTHIDKIQCQEGLMLAKNARTGDPMCLKPQTLAKLKERNWIQ